MNKLTGVMQTKHLLRRCYQLLGIIMLIIGIGGRTLATAATPTRTPRPTVTPRPTKTPRPTATPTLTPTATTTPLPLTGKLVFVSSHTVKKVDMYDIYLVDADGSNLTQL